jgi:hypothetical protein
MNVDSLPDFSGKVLYVGIAGGDDSAPIANAKWETIGEKLFLVGVVPKKGSGSDWVEGIECAIAWNSVTDYLLFDSPEEYQRRLKVGDDAEENKEEEE